MCDRLQGGLIIIRSLVLSLKLLKIVRRVRDNLHGSIDISELEDRVISHPVFQRLRRIRQTAFLSFVFPGASHTRFEHSLGVMHLAGIAWNKIYANQIRLNQACQRFPFFSVMEQSEQEEPVHGLLMPTFSILDEIFCSDYILQALRLAALLHDIGHPPFSHSGEKFLPRLNDILITSSDLPDYLQKYLISRQKKDEGNEIVSHEVYTMLLTEKLLTEVYQDCPELSHKIDPADVISILNPEITPPHGSPLSRLKVQGLCHELISGEIDIDRMDYLQRDSRECGVVYGMFDADRIMDSLALYFNPESGSMHLAIQFSGLAAFEDYLRARQSMYLQLYFHKTSVACEAMLQNLKRAIPDWHLPVMAEDYCNIDEHNIGQMMAEALKKSVGHQGELSRLQRLTEDLFRHRRLWKRVYEVAPIRESGEGQGQGLERVIWLLEQAGISYELVSSKNYLTKFRPRRRRESSENYLRLIKKDEKQFPRVVPVEDYSSLIREGMVVHLHRIYTSPKESLEARRLIMDSFFENEAD